MIQPRKNCKSPAIESDRMQIENYSAAVGLSTTTQMDDGIQHCIDWMETKAVHGPGQTSTTFNCRNHFAVAAVVKLLLQPLRCVGH